MAIRDLIQGNFLKKNVPVRREEWISPFYSLQKEINRIFDNFFNEITSDRFFGDVSGSFVPSVDVKEKDKEIIVTAELPGMDAEDIEINISDDVLTLRGEKREEKEEKEGNFYRRECSYGSFHRDIPLPAEIDPDKVEAEFKRGVLKVRLPKKPESERKAKKIEVKTK
ncbi:heat shock protein Hsp20 [Caldithrix abyssi DSM 13497]|uniref:Heat shock protein Hsp20 n=1 Tax=Caldithrix abyssi DSM 13497 TaxID=880073 RepID=H1XNY0_CALAY|nr:Hsp20/alpha crystallin family protein [Caldithrix abyssi]APF20506.1 heat shock protein Hsp20 [Caldithrix abyssi DSM 13497]EHO40972.1 heat shock protein Hsp20 [Caldithrix abyssi DSM 13497]